MRKFNLLMLLLVLSIGFTACKRMSDGPPEEQSGKYPIEILSEIYQSYATRVDDGGFVAGDKMGVYVVDYNNTTPGVLTVDKNRGNNVRYTVGEDGKWIAGQTLYFKDDKTNIDIYGYYPFVPTINSVDSYLLSVRADQDVVTSANGLGGYEASDFLWGKTENIVPTAARTIVTLKHKMACVNVKLTEGTGFTTGVWSGLEKQMMVMNTKRDASINLATGVVEAVGNVSPLGIVPMSGEGNYRAIVVPQSVVANAKLFSITVDGTAYSFVKGEGFEYLSGKMHNFTVTVSKKSDGGLDFGVVFDGISPWEVDNLTHGGVGKEYVVVNVETPGTLGEVIVASGKNPAKLQNLKLTGSIDARDFDFMRDKMTELAALNIKEVSIAKYDTYAANEIPRGAMTIKRSLTRLTLPDNITKINGGSRGGAFSGTGITGSIIIPEGVVEIGSGAFSNCARLTGTLTLPSTLVTIGDDAFSSAEGLVGNISIPTSVRHIGESAFSGCTGLTGELILSADLETLGSRAFSGCEGLTGGIIIPEKIKEIPYGVFSGCKNMKGQIRMPSDVTSIGYGAFSGGFRGEIFIPEGVTKIENGYGSYLSGNLVIPEGVTYIANNAFSGMSRLTGVVTIPEGLTSVPEGVFRGCGSLEGVILPSTMEQIREKAFENCFQFHTFVCLAKDPPVVRAGAFNGVAKDNFTIEVPEQSIAAYQTAPGWKDFKRISAYRDFTINRRLIRALNAPFTQTLVLRTLSTSNWSVESKPDWVTVNPSSGTGKADITVTINQLAKNAGDRTGEITFLLDGQEYRTKATVEQYDYIYGDTDVQTLKTKTKGNGVNVVFMGDGWDAKDIKSGAYKAAMEEAWKHFLAVEPIITYADYFSGHTVYALSPESGLETINAITQNKFGTTFVNGLQTNYDDVLTYACHAPINNKVDNTIIVLVPNSPIYGGITNMWGDGTAVAICSMSDDYYPYDFRGLVQHEAVGHALGKLGDEYIYTNGFVDNCSCGEQHATDLKDGQQRGWFQNLALTNNYTNVPWAEFIFHPKYADIVDVYEGGWFHTRKVWRSERNSCMNNNIPYFSAVSRKEIVKRTLTIAGETFNFNDFVAKDVTDAAKIKTKTLADQLREMQTSAPAQHHPPVYMGDKPKFKLPKK